MRDVTKSIPGRHLIWYDQSMVGIWAMSLLRFVLGELLTALSVWTIKLNLTPPKDRSEEEITKLKAECPILPNILSYLAT